MSLSRRIFQVAGVALIVILFCDLSVAGESPSPFQRADVNGDGRRDLSDGVAVLLYLFVGTDELSCLDAADTNDDGNVELSDAVGILSYLFRSGDEPAAPHGGCGQDPTPDDLGCAEYPVESCPDSDVPESPLPEFLDILYPDESEECCLDGVGVYTVAAGQCESLGGTVVVSGVDPACEIAASPDDSEALDWYVPPPEGAIDPIFPVEVILEDGSGADFVTFDLIAKRSDGDDFGPMRLDTVPVGPDGGGAGSGMTVGGSLDDDVSPIVVRTNLDLIGYPRGQYEIVAVAWKGDGQPPTDVRVFEAHLGGEEEEIVEEIAAAHLEVVAVSRPSPVDLDPVGPETLSIEAILELASFAPANDPEMEARLANLENAAQQLKSVSDALNTPKVVELKEAVGQKTEQLNEEIRRIKQCEGVESGLTEEIDTLSQKKRLKQIVENFFKTYFGGEWCEKVKRLIERREVVLAGVAQPNEEQLDDALADVKKKLKDKCDELDAEKDKLDDLNNDLGELESKIRDAYAGMLDAAGQYVAQLYFKGPAVHSRVVAIHVTASGEGIPHVPTNRAYRDAEEALEGLKDDYADKWKEVDDQQKKVEALETEKKELEDLINKSEAGATEVDQIDDALAKYFDVIDGTPSSHLRYMKKILDALDTACPTLSSRVRALFANVPTTTAELARFKKDMEKIRTDNNQELTDLANDINDKEQQLTTKQEELAELRAKARKCAGAIHVLQEELAEEKNAAVQEAQKVYQEELEKMIVEVQGWKDDVAFQDYLEELKRKVLEHNMTATQQLLALTGLGALDEIAPGMGKALGVGLAIANLPACFCKFLRALADLVLPSNQPTATYAAATVAIKRFEDCTQVKSITTVALTGAKELAANVNALSKEQKSIMFQALMKARRDFGCP